MPRLIPVVTTFCLLMSLAGCMSGKMLSESYVREDANPELINRVAVLPFEGSGKASRIRELTVTTLLSNDFFDVVDMGQVDIFLKREGISAGAPIDAFTIRRLGENLKVDAIVLGSIDQGRGTRGSATYTELSMTLRLIGCQNSTLLWQASGRASSYSILDRLFGLEPKDDFELTLDLLYRLFSTMQGDLG